MTETLLTGTSADILAENIEKLRSIFPEVFTEDKIDFVKLQAVLGNYVETENERYNFTWHGKSQALRLSQATSTGTLRPCKEESKDWDTTGNLYIEGDNLEVLKLLQKSYHGKVKMIYIDPPYNTGNDFIYPDDYKDNLENYLRMTGQVNGEGRKLSTNSESSGRYHTNWLNMMYPRLRLARNLLTDDGVVFISIDDNEVQNLRKICDEVFGEENFSAAIIWEKVYSPRMDVVGFSSSHDYILCYVKGEKASIKKERFEQNASQFGFVDEYTGKKYRRRSVRKEGSHSTRSERPNLFYPLFAPDGKEVYPIKPDGTHGCWRWSYKTYLENKEKNQVEWVKTEDGWQVYAKQFIEVEAVRPSVTLWRFDEVGHNHSAAENLKELLEGKAFTSPKPVELIQKMLNISTEDDSIILDFFSGSATSAHAVIKQNAEDGLRRQFIMIQLPEPCPQGTEAYKLGYKNICELGKERIRRAGDKIMADLIEKQRNKQISLEDGQDVDPQSLDVGFKTFKLDSSNLKKWNPNHTNLDAALLEMIDNYVDCRTEEDVVYEILLKYGVDLALPIEETDIDGKKVYLGDDGKLIICLNDEVTTKIASGIVSLKEELKPEILRVVMKDNGFKSDSAKANVKEILKRAGVNEFVTV